MQRGNKRVDLITEELFREAYRYEEVRKPPLKRRIAKEFKCTRNTPFNLFPIAKWLPQYSIKRDFLSDIIAGVTVAVMHIPHGLAYAPLGRVEPVVGFYMAIFPVFIYMFMGTSRHISIGTFAVLCAMVGQIVVKHEIPRPHDWGPPDNSTNETSTTTEAPDLCGKWEALQVGAAVCLLVGVWQGILGLLRMGAFTVIMSESLVSGFTTGAAVHVLSYQLKNLFGVKVAGFTGPLKLIHIYIDFFSKIKTGNLLTVLMSAISIAILLLFNEFVKPLIQKKFPKNKIPVPIELIVIILGILVSYFGHLSQEFNVKTVQHIPTGFPKPALPPLKLLPHIIVDSFIVAVVAIAINLSLAKIFAKKDDYVISNNQEIIAYGIANMFSSFFWCLPSAASLSRSTIQYTVGGKTQLASLFSITLVVFILLVAGSLFEPVPYCVLSSIVVVTLKGLLMQITELPRIWRRSSLDGVVWLGTFLAVIIIDLDYGLGIGVILSLLTMIFGFYSLRVVVLGRVPNTNLYLDLDHFKSAEPVPNVLVLEIVGNVNFANCGEVESRVVNHFKEFSESLAEEQSYVVLNMTSVSRIDPTSVNSLIHLFKYLKKLKCDLYVTDCNVQVYRTFEICNIFKDIPKEQILATVNDAVEYILSLKQS